MEANELMIGGYMMAHYDDGEDKFDFPIEIDGIDENATLVDGTCMFSWSSLYSKHDDIEFIDDFEPIELTGEILEKNDWKKSSTKDCVFYWHENIPFCVPMDGFHSTDVVFSDDYFESVFIRVKYVHELQIALRLCKLNDRLEL